MSNSIPAMPGLAAMTSPRWPRLRPEMITWLSSLWKASANPRPIPEPPPVMKMVLPESFMPYPVALKYRGSIRDCFENEGPLPPQAIYEPRRSVPLSRWVKLAARGFGPKVVYEFTFWT